MTPDLPTLLERLGLAGHGGDPAELQGRLKATGQAIWERLRAAGRLHPRAVPPQLELPSGFAEWLAAALALERAEGGEAAEARWTQLRGLYLEGMPALRVEQLAVADPPNGFLFHADLEWSRLPRLSGALERLFALLAAADVPPDRALGVPSLSAFINRYRTLAELVANTYFGRFMPFLYGYPADLQAYRRELEAESDAWGVFDRRLAAPILHELMHFQVERRPLLPPFFDECVAGYLGVHLLPEFAYPAPGQDNGLYGSPWFSQVGQALARVTGLPALVRAQAGVEPWETALPAGLSAAAERLGWERYRAQRAPHFLLDNVRPEPWMKLFFLARAGEPLEGLTFEALLVRPFESIPVVDQPDDMDRLMLRHALLAMCLHNTQDEGAFRVRCVAPASDIRIDLAACRVSRPSEAGSVDPAPPAYIFPPVLAAAWRARGVRELEVRIEDPACVDAVVDRLWPVA